MSITRTVKLGHRVKSLRVWLADGVLNDRLHSRSIPRMRYGLSALWSLNPVIPTLSPAILHDHILTSLGLKLLGIKNKSEVAFEDNVKHALFIYPDELVNDSVLCASFPF